MNGSGSNRVKRVGERTRKGQGRRKARSRFFIREMGSGARKEERMIKVRIRLP